MLSSKRLSTLVPVALNPLLRFKACWWKGANAVALVNNKIVAKKTVSFIMGFLFYIF